VRTLITCHARKETLICKERYIYRRKEKFNQLCKETNDKLKGFGQKPYELVWNTGFSHKSVHFPRKTRKQKKKSCVLNSAYVENLKGRTKAKTLRT
jgi:hypothetical protein